jgi:hypothetical protein
MYAGLILVLFGLSMVEIYSISKGGKVLYHVLMIGFWTLSMYIVLFKWIEALPQ